MKLVLLNRIVCGAESNRIVFVLSESPISNMSQKIVKIDEKLTQLYLMKIGPVFWNTL